MTTPAFTSELAAALPSARTLADYVRFATPFISPPHRPGIPVVPRGLLTGWEGSDAHAINLDELFIQYVFDSHRSTTRTIADTHDLHLFDRANNAIAAVMAAATSSGRSRVLLPSVGLGEPHQHARDIGLAVVTYDVEPITGLPDIVDILAKAHEHDVLFLAIGNPVGVIEDARWMHTVVNACASLDILLAVDHVASVGSSKSLLVEDAAVRHAPRLEYVGIHDTGKPLGADLKIAGILTHKDSNIGRALRSGYVPPVPDRHREMLAKVLDHLSGTRWVQKVAANSRANLDMLQKGLAGSRFQALGMGQTGGYAILLDVSALGAGGADVAATHLLHNGVCTYPGRYFTFETNVDWTRNSVYVPLLRSRETMKAFTEGFRSLHVEALADGQLAEWDPGQLDTLEEFFALADSASQMSDSRVPQR